LKINVFIKIFLIYIIFLGSNFIINDLSTQNSAQSVTFLQKSKVEDTRVFNYEFNDYTGYQDQYISNLSFNKNEIVTITASWSPLSEYDIMDFGLYIGNPGSELPGYESDEIAGWPLASGGGSPEVGEIEIFITSDQYYLRLINYAGYATSGSIVIQVSDVNQSPYDFEYFTPTNISIILVGYTPDYFNETEFKSYLPNYHFRGNAGSTIPFIYNYNIFYANSSYESNLNDFVLSNSVSGTNTTSKVNITALEIQMETLDRQDIFLPQDGRAINATAVDEYFQDNPYDLSADYSFYILNFSRYDNNDHSQEHWFNLTEIDSSIGINRHWWRLEWDNPMNFDAAFPYAGFSHTGRHYFFDPYAFQWYLNWTVIWRGVDTTDGLHDFYAQDLDEFLKTRDINTETGLNQVMRYLSSWVAEVIPQLISWSAIGDVTEFDSFAIETIVVSNTSHLGLEKEDLTWTVDEQEVKSRFEELLPNVSISVNTTFFELSERPEFEEILLNNQYTYPGDPPQENWLYVYGHGVFDELRERREIDFDITKADNFVTAYLFILDNASFASSSVGWAGSEFTGLGGGGHVTQLLEIDRLYYPDRISKRNEMTEILVHEAGHAIGFPHVFSSTQFAGDFIWDVMGYYPGTSEFSHVRKEGYQRFQLVFQLKEIKATLISAYETFPSSTTINNYLKDAETLFAEIEFLFDRLMLSEVSQKVSTLREIETTLIAYLNNEIQLTEPTTTIPSTTSDSTTGTIDTNTLNTSETSETSTAEGFTLIISGIVLGLMILSRRRTKTKR
jgi:hypothetical protein